MIGVAQRRDLTLFWRESLSICARPLQGDVLPGWSMQYPQCSYFPLLPRSILRYVYILRKT